MTLPKELLKLIVKEVSTEFDKQTKKKQQHDRDWRLRNTQYLLKNYRKLKSHCEASLADIKQQDEILLRVHINSVAEYKLKTIELMDYVDLMLDSYERYSLEQGESVQRRFKVLKELYINRSENVRLQRDLAEEFGVEERTIRRDLNKAIDEFSVYLFGAVHLADLIDKDEL